MRASECDKPAMLVEELTRRTVLAACRRSIERAIQLRCVCCQLNSKGCAAIGGHGDTLGYHTDRHTACGNDLRHADRVGCSAGAFVDHPDVSGHQQRIDDLWCTEGDTYL